MDIKASDLMREDYLKIDKNKNVSELISKLKTSKYNNVLIFDDSEFLGMASVKSLLRKRIDFSKTKCTSVVESVPRVEKNTSLVRIAELMLQSGKRILPVIEDNILVGVVPSQKVIEQVSTISKLSTLKAEDVASRDVLFLEETDSVEKAIDLMRSNDIKKIPVYSNGVPVGLLSWDAIASKYLLNRSDSEGAQRYDIQVHSIDKTSKPLKSPISNEYSKGIEFVSPNDSISKIVPLVRTSEAILVREKNKTFGLITNRNLIDAIVSLKEEARNIQIINLPKLDEIDFAKLDSTISSTYDRITKRTPHKPVLSVHFKRSDKGGLKIRHSIHARLFIPGMSLRVDEEDWNVLTVVQNAMASIEKAFKKQLE